MKTILWFFTGFLLLVCSFSNAQDFNTTYGIHAGPSTNGMGNSHFGYGAGRYITTGQSNCNFGANAGSSTTSGNDNCNFGVAAGANLKNGNANANFGTKAGYYLSSGGGNCNFGFFAGYSITSAHDNNNFGYEAGRSITTGYYNNNFGTRAGEVLSVGEGNNNFGYEAGKRMTTASYNSNFGDKAGISITTGNHNNNFGASAGSSIADGKNNNNYGSFAGRSIVNGFNNNNFGFEAGGSISSGSNNVNIGHQAGNLINLGSNNNNVGAGAGRSITTGGHNNNIGYEAGRSITSGSYNSNIGHEAGLNMTTGTENTTLGYRAGWGILDGKKNTNLGFAANFNVNGNGNTVLGAHAGDKSTAVSSSYNVLLGFGAGRGAQFSTDKSIFVLNNQAQMSNPLLFGYFADNENHESTSSAIASGSKAQLAVNTTKVSPVAALTINGLTYMGNLDSKSPATIKADHLSKYNLWVEKGIVSENFAVSTTTQWPDYVFELSYSLPSLGELETYILKNKHLPNIPSAAQIAQEGYSLQEMDKKFMEKIEELTLYTIQQNKQIQAQQTEIDALKKALATYQQLAIEVAHLQQQMKNDKEGLK